MKVEFSAVTVSLLAGSTLLSICEGLSCKGNSIGFDWTGSTIAASNGDTASVAWESDSSSQECGQDICTATEFDIDLEVTIPTFLGFDVNWIIASEFGLDLTFCGNSAVCDVLAGGSDSCNAIKYDFTQWFPTSCDTANDYDATTMDFNITYKYGCCTTENCNENFDYSVCEYNEDLGGFVSELFECWNGVRKDFMTYLVCDEVGRQNVYEFEGECRNEGVWTNKASLFAQIFWGARDCTYELTCTDTIRTMLINFGECACQAATSNNYPGVVISEIMETNWDSYCPGIDLSCSPDGILELVIEQGIILWNFAVGATVGNVVGEVVEKIINAIAVAAHVAPELITFVEAVANEFGNTNIQIQIIVETEDDADIVAANLVDSADDKVATSTGYETGNSSATVTTQSETLAGSDDDASKVLVFPLLGYTLFSALVVLVCN